MPNYKFVVTFGEKQRANHTIRSHAIRTAREIRSNDLNNPNNSQFNLSQMTISSKSGLKGRFRLPSVRKQDISVNAPVAGHRQIVNPIDEKDAVVYPSSDYDSISQPRESYSEEISKRFFLHDSMNTIHWFQSNSIDPFETMPMEYNWKTAALIRYCFACFNLNSPTVDPSRSWFVFAMTEPLIMASTLALTGTYCVVDCSLMDLRLKHEAYRQQGEVMRIVNRRLQDGKESISDAVVASVATLVNIDVLAGSFETAAIHLKGLAQIVEIRGGFETVRYVYQLSRSITWADIHTATALGRKPIFPLLSGPDELNIPNNLIEQAKSIQISGLSSLGGHASELVLVLTTLRQIALTQTIDWIFEVSPSSTRILMNFADYSILQNFGENGCGKHECQVVKSIFAAAHAFLYGAFRGMPRKSAVFRVLIDRLRESLNEIEKLIIVWKNYLSSFLWVLFVGYAATKKADGLQSSDGNWFLFRLKSLMDVINLENTITKEKVERHLKDFVWTDSFCAGALDVLWDNYTGSA